MEETCQILPLCTLTAFLYTLTAVLDDSVQFETTILYYLLSYHNVIGFSYH